MSKKIVITGASSEIGQAICKRLDAADIHFILQCTKKSEHCADLQKKLQGTSEIFQADFTNDSELIAFTAILKDVDILINCAASTIMGVLPALTDADIQKMVSVNILALVKFCQAVIPGMTARRSGKIINISSVTATRGNRGQTVYSGTKGFMESFSRSLAAEYGSKGICINCIAPGPIDAGSLKEIMSYAPDEVKGSIASNRLGTPADVAEAVAFLAGDNSSFINGSTLSVDGGYMKGV